ncbi:hypothetical protein ACIPSA_37180 [Streptomyces sp. NPDC086549]|uniref:hypothetical protein n=1 Tax=Streptomyces sp. NPDC086549 TaxID=3365752 RepID=UPI00381AC608
MIKRRSLERIGTVAGALSAAVLLAVTQASAVTAEVERATALTGPSTTDGWLCTSVGPSTAHTAQACYSSLGDWLNIYDGKADGYSAVMDWEIRDPNNKVYRYGATFNADGDGADRYKNKDFPETNYSIRFRTCLGHWSTKLIEAGTCSAWLTTST